MNRRIALFLLSAAALAVGLVSACRQSEPKSVSIAVPQMADATSIRIITNAALDEIAGRYDGVQNDCEIDLAKGIVVYHEGPRLLSDEYRRRIADRLREVGLEGEFLTVRPNPPPPVPTDQGPFQAWPDRVTARISVPGMKTRTQANVAVDAIAFARLGNDDPRIVVDSAARTLAVTYEGLLLSPRSIEAAIASAGYQANDVPARLGAADSLPHGWDPILL